ncbi:hypothetical protein NDU88_000680 [Pleurodeles waltl]|uniref:Non-homologous end-joining factor 1 n=1 Tax=Pleurodeles waltl TaxID=8319 RepID=A0AAV7U5X4_PLEWA|nr:hypothetical protein NDU88_000680 [Pleurodeles waltl]
MQDLDTCLLAEPWKSVSFGSSRFMAKACFTDTGYALLVSDLSSAWYEQADALVVQARSQELNKRLKAPVSSFLKHLSEMMCPLLDGAQTQSVSFTCEEMPSKLSIRVKSELSGLPFYWDFRCVEASVPMVSRHLLRPLMGMSLALERQSQELAALLLRKDAEILDYREGGATLSRGRLETETFDETTFLENFLSQGAGGQALYLNYTVTAQAWYLNYRATAQARYLNYRATGQALYLNYRATGQALHLNYRATGQALYLNYRATAQARYLNYRATGQALHLNYRATGQALYLNYRATAQARYLNYRATGPALHLNYRATGQALYLNYRATGQALYLNYRATGQALHLNYTPTGQALHLNYTATTRPCT